MHVTAQVSDRNEQHIQATRNAALSITTARNHASDDTPRSPAPAIKITSNPATQHYAYNISIGMRHKAKHPFQ